MRPSCVPACENALEMPRKKKEKEKVCMVKHEEVSGELRREMQWQHHCHVVTVEREVDNSFSFPLSLSLSLDPSLDPSLDLPFS